MNPADKRTILVTFKVNVAEMQEILKRAVYAKKGNVSAWVREAALKFPPKKEKPPA